jgi:hypothetical protein
MYATNQTVLSKLRSQMTESRLNRLMSLICDQKAACIVVCIVAVIWLVNILYRMVMP